MANVKTLTFRATGVAPLVMHNGELANPLSEGAKALKKFTSKRDKTDSDHHEIARLEYLYGLWLSDGEPCIPAEAIEACGKIGAMKSKLGKLYAAGVWCETHAAVEYQGPRDPKALWESGKFVLQEMVKLKGRTLRTRPMFPIWSLVATVHYVDDIINEEQVKRAIEDGGRLSGYGDHRPKYGRFTVEWLEEGVVPSNDRRKRRSR